MVEQWFYLPCTKKPSRNISGPLWSSKGETSMSIRELIAFTTGEKRGVTRLTIGRLVGSLLNQSRSSCCWRSQVDKRKMGSVVTIAESNSQSVDSLANQSSHFAALIPWTLATGTSGKVKGDSVVLLVSTTARLGSWGSLWPKPFSTPCMSDTLAFLAPGAFLKTPKKPAWRIPWHASPNLGKRCRKHKTNINISISYI